MFVAARELALVTAGGGFSLQRLFLLLSLRSRVQALVAVAQGLRYSVAWGPSQTRDQVHVPCTGRWILNHWTTRQVYKISSFRFKKIRKIQLLFVSQEGNIWEDDLD